MSERLWLTEPRRTTCLATVTGRAGPWFTLDRTLYAPTSKELRHAQPHDQGTVWLEGEKRNLVDVKQRDGDVWHRLQGTVPALGLRVNCHLDADRRAAVSRAHTAMHLLRRALADVPLRASPEVKLGGTFRLDLAHHVDAPRLADAVAQVRAAVQRDAPVTTEYVLRELLPRVAAAQAFQPPEPFPGTQPSVPVVTVDGYACPCDGTHVDRTARIGTVVLAHVRPGRDGLTVVGKVTPSH